MTRIQTTPIQNTRLSVRPTVRKLLPTCEPAVTKAPVTGSRSRARDSAKTTWVPVARGALLSIGGIDAAVSGVAPNNAGCGNGGGVN